ncbi:putative serine/threonine-protein kinase [Ananas comosus]|uniref:Serine/threonine-protein kinase n=1 Tax=Ananas comosus TaxID=4615 RepID=A0A6P5GS44_ANACO|nr:putative serine/threonine-protein kinase [Ananas comosus]
MGTRFCCFRAATSRGQNKSHRAAYDYSGVELPREPRNVQLFSCNEMKSATRNFHPSNYIGRGGFGIVYEGILRDGTQVAIKSLSAESKQGTNEFLTEIDTISNVRHPNLVQLIGCCIEGSYRMLVYEYMDNNSLANALLGQKKCISLDWSKRATICIGTASGLAFLHEESEPRIVHRDIKASNILLDKDLVPKIGDFGLAKLFPDSITHISTRVAGTTGVNLAPEYALLGQLTKKADVYSFGVLLLEIVSGRSSSKSAWGHDMLVLVEWTWKLREEERLLEIVDPEIVGYPQEQVLRFIKVALLCTQAPSHQRPSMTQVVDMLSGEGYKNQMSLDLLDVRNLVKPGVSLIKDAGSNPSQKHESNYHSITRAELSNSFQASTVEVQPR